jgi:hypothetical protein
MMTENELLDELTKELYIPLLNRTKSQRSSLQTGLAWDTNPP